MKFPPATLICANNFHTAWIEALKFIIEEGADIKLGTREKKRDVRDAIILFDLQGAAINQILRKEIHMDYSFKNIDEYCKEFTNEWYEAYQERPDREKFSYLYYERLRDYPWIEPWRGQGGFSIRTIDQLDLMRVLLYHQRKEDFTSNKCHSITWIPHKDEDAEVPNCQRDPGDKPCLQYISLRYLGNMEVEIHYDWRSRDCFNAWPANIIALTDMVQRVIVAPNHCRIVRITDFSRSLHIYASDLNMAKRVRILSLPFRK